jgi:hypothetical protein
MIWLRSSIGKEPIMLGLEAFEHSSMTSILGVNMNLLRFVNRAVCHVVLLRVDPDDVRNTLDGRLDLGNRALPVKVMIVCGRQRPWNIN